MLLYLLLIRVIFTVILLHVIRYYPTLTFTWLQLGYAKIVFLWLITSYKRPTSDVSCVSSGPIHS